MGAGGVNYWERHIGDYARDAGHLSMLEHGAYTLLLDRYYSTEQPIPADQAHRICRARSKEERAAVDTVLAEFFQLVDEQWVNGRASREVLKAQTKIEAARTNGAKGGRPKKNPDETDEKPTGFPLGSVSETQPKAHQTPDTSKDISEPTVPHPPAEAGGSKAPTVPCPYRAIVDLYHQALPTLPKVRIFDGKTWDGRCKAMRELWGWILSSKRADGTRRASNGDEALAWVREYFDLATENDFVMSRTSRSEQHSNWRADLDYLLSSKGLRQVLEKTQVAA